MGVHYSEQFDWTEERIDTLKRLWANGLTGSKIADELGGGLTRSAVIAKAHRLGLVGRKAAERAAKMCAAAAPKLERTRPLKAPVKGADGREKLKRQRVTAQGHVMTVFDEALTDLPPDQSPDATPFLQRDGNTCRWPLNDVMPIAAHLCCGTPTPGDDHPYCLRHFEVSTRRAPATVRLAENEIARRKRQGQLNFEKRSDYRDAAWR